MRKKKKFKAGDLIWEINKLMEERADSGELYEDLMEVWLNAKQKEGFDEERFAGNRLYLIKPIEVEDGVFLDDIALMVHFSMSDKGSLEKPVWKIDKISLFSEDVGLRQLKENRWTFIYDPDADSPASSASFYFKNEAKTHFPYPYRKNSVFSDFPENEEELFKRIKCWFFEETGHEVEFKWDTLMDLIYNSIDVRREIRDYQKEVKLDKKRDEANKKKKDAESVFAGISDLTEAKNLVIEYLKGSGFSLSKRVEQINYPLDYSKVWFKMGDFEVVDHDRAKGDSYEVIPLLLKEDLGSSFILRLLEAKIRLSLERAEDWNEKKYEQNGLFTKKFSIKAEDHEEISLVAVVSCIFHEKYRIIYNENGKAAFYEQVNIAAKEIEEVVSWQKTTLTEMEKGRMYKAGTPSIFSKNFKKEIQESCLGRSGLLEVLTVEDVESPWNGLVFPNVEMIAFYLFAYSRNNNFEKLAKAGLFYCWLRLLFPTPRNIIMERDYGNMQLHELFQATSGFFNFFKKVVQMKDIFELDKYQGTSIEVSSSFYSKAEDFYNAFSNSTVEEFFEWIKYKNLDFQNKFISAAKIINRYKAARFKEIREYITKIQRTEYFTDESAVMNEWKDYLDLHHKVHKKTGYPLYLFPKMVKYEHDKMLHLYLQIPEDEIPDIEIVDAAQSIQEEFKTDLGEESLIQIVLPTSKLDFEKESVVLGNCIRMYSEKYADRETNIFFFRKKTHPDVPHLAVEISLQRQLVQAETRGRAFPTGETLDALFKFIVMNNISIPNSLMEKFSKFMK